jgi:hypothetical protein
MKLKLFTILIAIAILPSMNAQWSGTTTIYTTNLNAVVGIGTSSPAQKLHIKGGSLLVGNGASPGTNSGIKIIAPINSTHYNWQIAANQNVTNGFEITPSTATNGTTFSTPIITFLYTGNVGIGLTNPSEKLEVSGNIYISATAGFLKFGNGGGSWSAPRMWRTSNNTLAISDYNGVELGGYNGSSYGARFIVTGSGNVGIGIANPQNKLDVVNRQPNVYQ